MQRATAVLLLIFFSILISACGPRITPEEAKVLVVLDEIQRGVESNIDFDQFEQLLNTAKAEISLLEQNSKKNPCFMSAVSKCYSSYEIARKAWQRKEAEQDLKRKEDMEMTLSFSLSFSALNIKKANKCYE
jgi:dTDP-4-dehydrorhamnose reductase